MLDEILSVAVWEPVPGKEADSLTTIRELIAILSAKGYSRDLLYRDGESHYVLLRYWKSEASPPHRPGRSRHPSLLGSARE